MIISHLKNILMKLKPKKFKGTKYCRYFSCKAIDKRAIDYKFYTSGQVV